MDDEHNPSSRDAELTPLVCIDGNESAHLSTMAASQEDLLLVSSFGVVDSFRFPCERILSFNSGDRNGMSFVVAENTAKSSLQCVDRMALINATSVSL